MERAEKQKLMMDWAKNLAGKYDMFPDTVLEIYKNLVGRRYQDDVYMNRKQRTEEFLKLYFEGVKGE